MRNLPRFEGRKIKEEPKISPEIGDIKIAPKSQDSLPKLEEQQIPVDNTPKNLFGKIKELFKLEKPPSKTTINNVTYNTKNVSNNSTPTSNNKSVSNNSKNITEQNKKISIMNTFMGKNPTMVQSERLFNSNSPTIERNVNSIENNLHSIENLWKNEHSKVNLQNNNIENRYNIPTNIEEKNNNTNNNLIENNPSISSNNTKSFQNLTNIANTESNSKFYKTSVEKKPYFYQSKKIKYVFSPKHEKSFISFAEGGIMQQTAQNAVTVNQPTPIAMAGDKSSGAAEKIEVSPAAGPNSMDAAAKATTQASGEKAAENKQEQAKEEATGGEPQSEGGNGGSAIVNNISNNVVTKQMTTFEKVAIETAFLPHWRRILG